QRSQEKALQENRARLEDELQRNLKEQKELQGWLQEKQRLEAARERREQDAARQAARKEEDVRKSLENLEEAMRKGLEDATLDPDVLEKMDRIRELLVEVMDEGEKDRLRPEAGQQDIEPGDLQNALSKMLEKKD